LQVNIKNLVDDVQCYQTVRELRWPDGVECPSCQSKQVIKRGFDDTEPARQRYECADCHKRFDDLTDTIFAGHHQPLKVWILCLYFMGGSCWIPGSYTPRKGLKHLISNSFFQGCRIGRDHREKSVKTTCYAKLDQLRPWNPT